MGLSPCLNTMNNGTRVIFLSAAWFFATVITGRTSDLHKAAREDDSQAIISTLMSAYYAGPVNPHGAAGVTPLHVAASVNAINAMSTLLQAGADPDCQTEAGYTPLHWAVLRHAERAVQRLLQANADPNARSGNGVTPLHCAVKHDQLTIMLLLIEHGAELQPHTTEGLTPLMMGRKDRKFNETARRLAVIIAERSLAAGGNEAGSLLSPAPADQENTR